MKNTILILLLALFIGLAACKKDEVTDPDVNKDDLLCQVWKVSKEFINGVESEYLMEQYYTFYEDGTGESEIHLYTILKYSIQWQWVDNKENIEIIKTPENKNVKGWRKYKILNLTQDKLLFEIDYGSDIMKLEFVKN